MHERRLITNDITNKNMPELLILLERLAALFYIAPSNLKEFQDILDNLNLNLEQLHSGYKIPSHQFSENGKLAQALIDFTRKIF